MDNTIDIIQLISFRKATKKLFSEEDIKELSEFLGNYPEKGDIIPNTGGLRKLRWILAGRGKRGGSRIIYYYHRPEWQILLLTACAKNNREDLSEKEKKILSSFIKDIIKQE